MKKFIIQTVLLLITTTIILPFAFNKDISSLFDGSLLGSNLSTSKLKIKDQIITVELANTKQSRTKGLAGRTSIASDSGMLFLFDSPNTYKFWMKGMLIPLDIIYLKDGKVIGYLENIPPPGEDLSDGELSVYQPGAPVDSVLEVTAGFVAKNHIQGGDPAVLIE